MKNREDEIDNKLEYYLNKKDIRVNDILVFKNHHKAKLYFTRLYILNEFYDDDLHCLTNEEYDIIGIFRNKTFYSKNEFAKVKKI